MLKASDLVLRVLSHPPGNHYCAPCLAKAGIDDANEIRRLRERPEGHRPDFVVEQRACDTCHQARRTVSVAATKL